MTQPANDRSQIEAQAVIDELLLIGVVPPHPETLGDLGHPRAVLGLLEAIDYGPFEVANSNPHHRNATLTG
jgi:hypothetical protein